MGEKKEGKTFLHVQIPIYERIVYWVVWLSATTLPFYHAYTLSQKHHNRIKDDLTPSWFGSYKDANDMEWSFWWEQAPRIFLLYSFSTILTNIVKRVFAQSQHQQNIVIVCIIALHAVTLSVKGVLVILALIILFYMVSTTTRNISWVWFLSVATLYCIHNENIKTNVAQFLSIDVNHVPLVELAVMMSVLRIISFASFTDKHGNKAAGLVACLNYCLYIPVFHNGPIITFDTFYENVYLRAQQFPMREIVKDFASSMLNIGLLELFLHTGHVTALCYNTAILQEMSLFDAVTLFWTHLHIFNIKYFIFYRFCGLFAKANGINPPGPPKCIASLYTFVDMWRYFDKGLNRFFLQCIYFPLGGSRHGIVRQILASLACFLFIGYWHSGDKSVMFWALTNWLGISVEAVAVSLTKTELYAKVRLHAGDRAHRRLCALGGAFSVFCLIYTNMVFLVGYDAATVLLGRIFVAWYFPLVILFVFYCGNHCSIDGSYT